MNTSLNDCLKKRRHYFFITIIGFFVVTQTASSQQRFDIISPNGNASIVYAADGCKLDSIAANLLANDIKAVTNVRPTVTTDIKKVSGRVIIIGGINSYLVKSLKDAQLTKLQDQWECYAHKLVQQPFGNIQQALVVAGSDARGTAYGVFNLSEKIGVLPWYWWADVHPQKKQRLSVTIQPFFSSPPAVKFRGLFINDEDWGLQPWALKTFEPETGDIGPKTYAKVFELLLRLKANLIWPAMHPSTKAFFHYPGNIKAAEDYQVVIGSSHAEPMLRNNVDEWNEKTMGPFNYLTNKEKVYSYWEDRVKESSRINALYTMGMRGVHDSKMEGVKNEKEAVPLLEKIFEDQRNLLARYLQKEATAIPQVFTAYKEVLDIYDNGLKVPDDITLVWPDDNYGYIQRLNNEKEQARKGGAGVYYHASYWGRPHDYLWLPSTHPGLMREEMMKAYQTGANRLWVVNVGDIKPQEYNLQQFLDMAYDPAPFKESTYSKTHLLKWATAIFGKEKGDKVGVILWEYYRLAFERKPEFMGWSQTEPTTQTAYSTFNHFYFGDEAQKRIDNYDALEAQVKKLRPQIRTKDAHAFYQLVYYPVLGASWMNKKFLYRDKAYLYVKQGRLSAYDYAQWSKAAYDSIVKETTFYNSTLAGGKWKNIMSMAPRNLPVYQAPVLPTIAINSAGSWNLAPEGYVTKDSSLIDDSLSLPAFDNLNRQKYFIDVFLSKQQALKWTATVSHNWIRLSKSSGIISDNEGKKQVRIWADVDWNKVTSEKAGGAITFIAGGKQITVTVQARKFNHSQLKGFNGFVENNGFVAMQASHFTAQKNSSAYQWRILNGIGYTGSALQALPLSVDGGPLTNPDSIKQKASFAAYDFYTLSSAAPIVYLMALPTHPVNNNFSVRYALSIDDGPVKIADIRTFGRSDEWKQNVLRNRSERKIEMPFLKKGRHTLKIFCVDPGVILDELIIDVGGLKQAYSTIAETRLMTLLP